MSNFRKAALRVVALSALILGTISLMQPTNAYALSCLTECAVDKNQCIADCNGDPVCTSGCQPIWLACACSCKPALCS
jgi:hypothetical protein